MDNLSEKDRRLFILKKENTKDLDSVNILLLDTMSIAFIDKYIRKRKLLVINEIKD